MKIEELLKGIRDIVIADMKNKNRTASGKTINEIEINMINPDRGQILVPSWFKYIEKGSGPGYRGKWFYEEMKEWVLNKKITTDETEAKKIGGKIAGKIIKEGTNAYRIGGEDVFSSDIDNYINENLDSIALEFKNNIRL